MACLVCAAHQNGLDLRTSAAVLAQVWRLGQPAHELKNLIRAIDVRPIDQELAHQAGALMVRTRTIDLINASLVLIADHGDRILTEEPSEITRLARAANKRIAVISC